MSVYVCVCVCVCVFVCVCVHFFKHHLCAHVSQRWLNRFEQTWTHLKALKMPLIEFKRTMAETSRSGDIKLRLHWTVFPHTVICCRPVNFLQSQIWLQAWLHYAQIKDCHSCFDCLQTRFWQFFWPTVSEFFFDMTVLWLHLLQLYFYSLKFDCKCDYTVYR